MLDSIRTFVGADGALLLSWRDDELASVVGASPELSGERSVRLGRAALVSHDGAILDADQARELLRGVSALAVATPIGAAWVYFAPLPDGSKVSSTALILLWLDGSAVPAERLRALRPLIDLLLESDAVQRSALRAAQRLDAVTQLAAGVAHDFSNILTVISGGAEMMDEPRSPRERENEVAVIRQAARRGHRLVRQLLSFSGHALAQRGLLAVDELLRKVEPLLIDVLEEGWSLSLQPDAIDARVLIDEKQLTLVLANLLATACESMTEGGVITVRSARVAMASGLASGGQESNQWVAIALSNEDARIPAMVYENLHEPFASLSVDSGRLGFGLETIAAIIEQAGGTIRYSVTTSAAKPTGHTYILYIPDADLRPSAQRQHTPARGVLIAPAIADLPMLVVDDDAGPRRVVRRLLEREGYEVIAAESALEALGELESREGQFFGVVSDYLMPGMSGMELLTQIRRRWPDLPVVLVSGFTSDDVTGGALRDLRAHFLPKPFTRDELLNAVRKARAVSRVT